MNEPIISLNNITYTYPSAKQPALRNLSLDVEAGEFLLVTGVSGAGKSTLLRLFNGLVPHFYGGHLSGSVRVAGRDPIALGPGEMSDTVGLVFQDPEAQFVAEIVEDELAFALENAGLPMPLMRKRVEEIAPCPQHRTPARAARQHPFRRRTPARGNRGSAHPPAPRVGAGRAYIST